MKLTHRLIRNIALALFAAQAGAAGAQATAPYNEAVRMMNGKRVVEVAPFPAHMQGMVPAFQRPDENPPMTPYVNVVETPGGLMDCRGTYWYHPKACSPSTFGKEKTGRQWVVKLKGQWQVCLGREAPQACIPMAPDGRLHALPTPPQE
ncbi:hypothetical protein AACH06_25870 [Ideonella sp. DXS29W]|uniref:Uncharacterized protein n=1 Tax=Ideonella lacteola TaxID=2984193 RepID=A0ABU9BWB9_9BURK